MSQSLADTLFPRTTEVLILAHLEAHIDKVVTIEELCEAVHGITPFTAGYKSSREWKATAVSHIRSLRVRLIQSGLAYDIENVYRRGYRLVKRKPRKILTIREREQRKAKVIQDYKALRAEIPGASVYQIYGILQSRYSKQFKLYYATLRGWVREEPRHAQAQPDLP